MKNLIFIFASFIAISAIAKECPTGTELYSKENVHEYAGYVIFRDAINDNVLEYRSFTRNGCFIDSPRASIVEGYKLEELAGKTMWVINRIELLDECTQFGDKKFFKAGEIKATGMISDWSYMTSFRGNEFCY